MNSRILFFTTSILFFLLLFTSCNKYSNLTDENFKFAEAKTKSLLASLDTTSKLPRTVSPDGKLACVGVYDWTSGFFPGSLWYLYEYSQDEYWKNAAEKYTRKLDTVQYYTKHHDLGFMMYCSYGNGYRLTGNEAYKEVLINSAKSLSTRFVPAAGIIKSWDFSRSWSGTPWHCPVIIDNMMNLELLFFASKATGDEKYKNIAVTHAENTLKYHIRDDYSSYHVVNYDTLSGKPTDRGTRQGLADNSAWARGQAWAIYGFTMTYRETNDEKYLDAAKKLADFYINHPRLPEDFIPLWDFNAGDPNYVSPWNYNPNEFEKILRDVSASAVTASGLLELSTYTEEGNGSGYFKAAEKILLSLQSKYKNTDNKHHFILNHSVGDYPGHLELDVPLVYADYYFLEALLRYDRLQKGKPVV